MYNYLCHAEQCLMCYLGRVLHSGPKSGSGVTRKLNKKWDYSTVSWYISIGKRKKIYIYIYIYILKGSEASFGILLRYPCLKQWP